MTGRPNPGTCRALILAPTRELAVQISDNLRAFAGGARLSTCLVLGGVSINGQIKAIARTLIYRRARMVKPKVPFKEIDIRNR